MTPHFSIPDISEKIQAIRTEVAKEIIGQDILVRNILLAIFSGGHILLE